MSEDKKDVVQKIDYQFGTIEKIVLEAKNLDLSVFACAHAMPGGDGCDPTSCRSPPMS